MAARAQTRVNLTDRAKRYRAQKNVTGPKKCVLCGSAKNLGVMHLDGNEDHGEPENLAWGCKSCNGKLAAAFKRLGIGKPTNQYNPAKKDPPTYAQYAWAVSNHTRGAHDEGGAVIHATPKHLRIEYAQRIAEAAGRTKRERFDERWNPATGAFERCVETVSKRGGATDPRAVCAAAGRKKYGQAEMTRRAVAGKKRAKRNPADVSAEVFEEFHGYASSEVVAVKRDRHHHEHLAAAGELVGLQVKPVGHGLPVRKIEGLGKNCFLAFNEAKNQLFIEGGNQGLTWDELKSFGIRTEHELQTLGKLVAVGYFTDKVHLGEDGGEAIYSHVFRTTNENGKHIVVTIARYPDLIYRVLDEQFEISGGDYKIRREGIDV